jgi:peptidoglycan/LPS O-acetylase OafA/YrhL
MSPSTRFLDGLRGLAALYVVIHHARYLLHEGYSEGYLRHPETYSLLEKSMVYALAAFRWGHEAVLFFFVLSGFVIHLRYAREAIERPERRFGLGGYLLRRARRLYPPLLAALLITFALDYLGMRLALPIYFGQTPYTLINETIHPHLDLATLAGNLAFVMDTYVPAYGSNGPLWSLKYEWWFYMLYPAFWWIGRRSLLLATALMLILWAASQFPAYWPNLLLRQVFTLMIVWWIGALLAELHVRQKHREMRLVALLALVLPYAVLFKERHRLPPELFGVAFSGVIAAGFAWQATVGRLTLLDRLKWLGDMSYSLYVCHMPILVFGGGWLMSRSPVAELPRTFLWLALGVGVCLLVAFVVHLFAERPFTRSAVRRVDTRAITSESTVVPGTRGTHEPS